MDSNSKFFIDAACDDGFPYEWAMHHLKIYIANNEKVSPTKFVCYLRELEARRTVRQINSEAA
jgi:hypothetical protein